MSKNSIVVVTDVGSSKIATLIADIDELGEIHIIGSGESLSNGIEKGSIVNSAEFIKSCRESISNSENSSGFKVSVIISNISGQYMDFKTEKDSLTFEGNGKEIDDTDIITLIDKVSEKIPKDNMKLLHILPKRYVLDNDLVLDPVGLIGNKLEAEFNIITIKSNIYNNLKKSIESAGVEVIDFVANPIASSSAVLFEEEKDIGVACVDIGGGLSDIAVYKNGNLEYVKSIPVGGMLVTKDIAYRFKIPKEVAEGLKKQLGIASKDLLESNETVEIPSREDEETIKIDRYDIAETIEWRLTEMLEIIRKELEKSGLYEKLNAGIVLTGGVANTPYIQFLAEKIFEKDVRIGKPKDYRGFSDKFSSPEYATAVGMLHFIKAFKFNNRSFTKDNTNKGLNFGIFNKFFGKIKELF
ncbi:MAG: cell division protein FtsA [Hydrogenothermaceae bacterium]